MGGDDCGTGGSGYPSDCEVTQGLRERSQNRVAQERRSYRWRACLERAREVKLLLLDVDGVLTDGSIIYTPEGREIYFHENALKDLTMDQLGEGLEVRFGEAEGEKGPQANWVKAEV